MSRIRTGDLVRMKTHDTGLVGVVVDMAYPQDTTQIGIYWWGSKSDKIEWEPEAWLEIISSS